MDVVWQVISSFRPIDRKETQKAQWTKLFHVTFKIVWNNATVLFVCTISGMAGNASLIIMITVLSFFIVFAYSGYLYCHLKNEINYLKE